MKREAAESRLSATAGEMRPPSGRTESVPPGAVEVPVQSDEGPRFLRSGLGPDKPDPTRRWSRGRTAARTIARLRRRCVARNVTRGYRPSSVPVREWDAVVVLKAGRLGATAFRSHEPHRSPSRALTASNRRRDIAGTRIGLARWPRSIRAAVLHLFELLDEQRQRRSITAASSALRFVCRNRSCAWRSLARVSTPIVTWSLKRSGAMARTMGRSTGSGRAGRRRSRRLRRHRLRNRAGLPYLGTEKRRRDRLRFRPLGNFRTEDRTSGCGFSVATIISTSALLLCRADSSSATWFSAVRCRPRSVTVVSVIAPSTSKSITSGYSVATFAAAIRA